MACLLSSQPSLTYQIPTDTYNLDSKFLPVSFMKCFLLIPEELGKHNKCLLTLPFSTCIPFLGIQIYFNGTLFQFQSVCFMWGWLYPRDWGSRACDLGRASLYSSFPWPQPLFRYEHMIKSGPIKVRWNSMVALLLELLGKEIFFLLN